MRLFSDTQLTIIFIALFVVSIRANGQNTSKKTPPVSLVCKASQDVLATDLYGPWVLEFSAAGATKPGSNTQSTRLFFKQNPEFAESLAGEFNLSGLRMEVFGDIEDGALDLEESANGKDISAIWKGRISEGSCGQAITGTRRMEATQTEQGFVLRRAGW
jgi:hypothetical protein